MDDTSQQPTIAAGAISMQRADSGNNPGPSFLIPPLRSFALFNIMLTDARRSSIVLPLRKTILPHEAAHVYGHRTVIVEGVISDPGPCTETYRPEARFGADTVGR